MKVEAAPRIIKTGRGIELTTEALIELIRQRFPNLVDWEMLANHTPGMNHDPATGLCRMYFSWIGEDDDRPDTGAFPIWRVGEGAPIPVVRIGVQNLKIGPETNRCGYFEGRGSAGQCLQPIGHDGEHAL